MDAYDVGFRHENEKCRRKTNAFVFACVTLCSVCVGTLAAEQQHLYGSSQ